jgi:hypothetical protein
MKVVALLLAVAFALGACGDPSQQPGASGRGDSPASSTPDRPSPDDMATLPPTDQCGPGAEVSEDGSAGDAIAHERCPANDDFQMKAEFVEPRPGMVDVRPIPWTRVTTSDNGRVLTVRFWSGVEPCSVLDHVDVEYSEDSVTVTLYEGRNPDQQDVACIEIAMLKAVRIELEAPLGGRRVRDGAKNA